MSVMEIHQEVVAQREALASLVRRLDPDELPASQAPALWRELDVMGRQIAAAKALVARRVEDSHRWKGEVSPQQGALIADAAKVNPAAERSLLASARKDSFTELKQHVQRAKAAADPDPEATQRRIHQGRRLVELIDAEGAWNLHARGTVADGAKVHAALAPIIDERFRANRAAGRRDAAEANAFDALVGLADRRGAGSASHAATSG